VSQKKGQPSSSSPFHSPRSLLVVRFCGYLETIQNGAGQMVEPNVLAQAYMSRTSFCLSLYRVTNEKKKKKKNSIDFLPSIFYLISSCTQRPG
jgi:hypothetical protein